jgi:hypothetical protein
MQLVMATRDEYLRDSVELWDVKNRTRVWKADVPRVEALSFNAECGKIAIGSTGPDAQLQVLDATTGSVLLTMPASESRIRSLAFDRNCRRLAQATDAGIDLWDTSTGVHLLTLRIPAGASGRPPPIVQAVQFSQDGQQLHALDSQWIRVYDAAPAYHPGAYELVNRLFNELFLSEDVLARLRSDASLDPGLRAAAIGLAEKYGDSPSGPGRESQRISVRPDQSPERYLRARRMAELCVQLNPTSGASQLSLGMALYRAGDYPAAAEALGRADRLPARAAQTKGAFLALTLARLGRADDARAELDKLRAEVDKRTLPLPPGFLKELPPQVAAQLAPRPDPYPEVTALMKEAEGLLAGKAR